MEHTQDKIKRLYPTFPLQPMTEITTAMLKRGHEAAEKCRQIYLKQFVNNEPRSDGHPENMQSLQNARDHYHYTALYRLAAHNNRNLKYQTRGHTPILFQKLSAFDVHPFIKDLEKRFNKDDIGMIAESNEKYISFIVKIKVKMTRLINEDGKEVRKNIQLRLIDSCRFTETDLNKLASNLDDDQFKQHTEFYNGEKVLKLMRSKDVYAYE